MGGGWRQQQGQTQQQHQQCEDAEKSSGGASQTAGRALRNRRYRRILEESQQTKRLFTPEIKRFLKGWLVRRRKNPYPNRSEKKELAFKTGLTYIQICNWFANWRRKLKNSSRNTEESWGHLIKDYNNKAKGNVEQFSISSEDSIWDENAYALDSERNSTIAHDCHHLHSGTDHSYYSSNNNNDEEEEEEPMTDSKDSDLKNAKEGGSCSSCDPPLLSKWVESAARYRASASYVPWAAYNLTWSCPREERHRPRHREELDAAEALAFLSAWAPPGGPITQQS